MTSSGTAVFPRLIGSVARRARACAVLAAALAVLPPPGVIGAQETLGTGRRQASRAELEQAIAATEAAASRTTSSQSRASLTARLMAMQQRLKNGDFAPGDRIAVFVTGDSTLSDTFVVRSDQRLEMRPLPAISLRGVLDSELSGYLTTEIAKYVKEPTVKAVPLVRLTMSGGIGRQGFFTVPLDLMLTDILMMSGGPSQASRLEKTTVVRAGETVVDGKSFVEAIRTGRTVGDLSLDDGDEIIVGGAARGSGFSLMSIMPYIGAVSTIFVLVRRSRY